MRTDRLLPHLPICVFMKRAPFRMIHSISYRSYTVDAQLRLSKQESARKAGLEVEETDLSNCLCIPVSRSTALASDVFGRDFEVLHQLWRRPEGCPFEICLVF